MGAEVPIVGIISDRTVSGVVTRIGETPQAEPSLLKDLTQIGVLPGETVIITAFSGGFELRAKHGTVTVTEDDAKHLFVTLE